MTTITIGGVVIPPAPGADGWWFNGLESWYDLTDDKMPVEERNQADGAFEVDRSLRQSSVPSFHVYIDADTQSELIRKQTFLASIGAAGPVLMQVADVYETTERLVSVRAVAPKDHRGRVWNELDFDCLARDPRRYSVNDRWVTARPPEPGGGLVWPAVSPWTWPGGGGSDGRVTLVNRGTKSSWPVYRLYGGFNSASIINVSGAQERVGFGLQVAAGSYVEIDFATRTAYLDGQSDVSRYLTSRQWWEVTAGASVVAQVEMDGQFLDPYMAGIVRSAW